MSDVAAVRRASPEDAAAVARLLHDFQLEFDEPSPGVEVLAERYENQLRDGDVTVLLVGAGPDGFAQLRFRPWVYDGLHSYLEELYVVPSLRGKGLGGAAGRRDGCRAGRGCDANGARDERNGHGRARSLRARGSQTAREVPMAR